MYWWGIPLMLALFGVAAATAGCAASQWVTPLIMLANWGACTAVVYVTTDDYPILFFMVADYGAAIGVFLAWRSHWQSTIMAVYATQLICHAAYAMSGMGPGPTYYSYWALTYMAWMQVALVGGWLGTELVGRWSSSAGPFVGRGRDKASAAAFMAQEGKK